MLEKLAAINQRLSPSLRQVMGNTAWLFSDRILRMSVGLLVGAWVARYLGPKQFGLYNYAITFVALFSPLAQVGLEGIVVRDIAQNPSCKNETLGTAFALKLVGGIVTLLLSLATILLLQPNDNLTHWLVGITAAGTIFQAFDTIDFWFQSQIQSKYTVYAKNVAYVLISFVKIALIQMRAPLIAFAFTGAAEIALGAMSLIFVYKIRGHNLKAWRITIARTKQLLKESWPLTVSGLTIYIYSKIDQVMLGTLADPSELGFYSVAVKLSEIFDFIPMMIYSSLLPKLIEAKNKGKEDYMKKFQLYFDLMLILWIIIALPVSIFASFIVNLLYGKSYAVSASILSIYVWAQFGSNFGVARSAFLLIEGKVHLSLYLTVIGAFVNVLLNLYLIPNFGAFGATVATLITYFIVVVFLNLFVKELRPVGTLIIRSLDLYHACLRAWKLVR